MVRLLAALWLLLAPVCAQAQGVNATIVSPTTLPVNCVSGCSGSAGATSVNIIDIGGNPTTSYLSTVTIGTVTVSPTGNVPVNCVTGCASAGASPATVLTTPTASPAEVLVGNTVTTSFGTVLVTPLTSPQNITISGSPIEALIGNTVPVSPTGTTSIQGTVAVTQIQSPQNVTVANTVTTSLSSPAQVVQVTSPWAINGAVAATQVTSPWAVAATQLTSPWGINGAVTIVGTVTTSLGTVIVTPAVSPQNVTISGSPAEVLVGNTVTTSMGTVIVTPAVSPQNVTIAGSPQTVLVTNTVAVSPTGTTSIQGLVGIGGTVTVSPTGTTIISGAIAEQDGIAYPNHAQWLTGSATATGTAATVLIAAPAANKLYITGIECGRTDGASTPTVLNFPIAQKTGVSLAVVISGNGGVSNMQFPTPLTVSTTTSLTFTPTTSITTLFCNAQGYNAP